MFTCFVFSYLILSGSRPVLWVKSDAADPAFFCSPRYINALRVEWLCCVLRRESAPLALGEHQQLLHFQLLLRGTHFGAKEGRAVHPPIFSLQS